MKYYILVIICLSIIGMSCGRRSVSKESTSIRENPAAISQANDKIIRGSQVGSISTGMSIEEITANIPSGYRIEQTVEIFDGDDPDNTTRVFNVCESDGTIELKIVARSGGGHSIMVFSPEYSIHTTHIRTGCSVCELKRQYAITDFYFNIADGLYLNVDGFEGVFLVDLENNGDTFHDLGDLRDDYKIKAIIVY